MILVPIRAVVLDLDGTLVDTLGDFVEAINLTLSDLQLPPASRLQVAGAIGKGSEHLVRTVLDQQWVMQAGQGAGSLQPANALARTQRLTALHQQALRGFQQHYRRVNGTHAEVYPGVVEGLQGLRAAGFPLACLTNKPLHFAQELLRAKALAACFERVFGGDSFARKKPDPLPLQKTCEALQTEPQHTLMVGDAPDDALAARAAGCPVALVTYGQHPGGAIEQSPHDLLLDSLAALPAALGRV